MSKYQYDHLIYIRLFEGCNLFCEHCFIPHNPKKIQFEYFQSHIWNDLEKYSNIVKGQKLYLQWHGGEPTILGADYLEDCIKSVENQMLYPLEHGIQTNLLNFQNDKEKWIRIYKKYFNSEIGVSWDYAIRHHKIKGIDNIKQASPENLILEQKSWEELFWLNVKDLIEQEIEPYLVVTFTKDFIKRFKNPFEFFDFMSEKGIKKLNFERITKNGMARIFWDKIGLNNLEYAQGMSKFYKAYRIWKKNNPEISFNISPFDGLQQSIENLSKSKNMGYGCWSGHCDTTFHTIDAHGYKKGCTALNSEEDNSNRDLTQIKNKVFWIKSQEILPQRQKRQEECTTCEFLSICSSGCLSVEKFDSSGECSGAKTLFKTIQYYQLENL